MSDQNGRSPTAIEVDGIVFDMNRITRREYIKIQDALIALQPKDGEEMSSEAAEKAQELSGQLYARIITSWPFESPVDKYTDLGMMDSQRVDIAYQELGEILKKKRLERLSTFLPDTSSPSMIPSPDTSTPA